MRVNHCTRVCDQRDLREGSGHYSKSVFGDVAANLRLNATPGKTMTDNFIRLHSDQLTCQSFIETQVDPIGGDESKNETAGFCGEVMHDHLQVVQDCPANWTASNPSLACTSVCRLAVCLSICGLGSKRVLRIGRTG